MNSNKQLWVRDAIKSRNKPIDLSKEYDSILEKSESNNFDCMYLGVFYTFNSIYDDFHT